VSLIPQHRRAKRDSGGRTQVGWMFTLAAAVYNLVRMRNLAALFDQRSGRGPTEPFAAVRCLDERTDRSSQPTYEVCFSAACQGRFRLVFGSDR